MSNEIQEVMQAFGITREEAVELLAGEAAADADREARGNCGRCSHFKPDPDATLQSLGEPHPDAGLCLLHGKDGNGPCLMLSGDWCQQFEGKP